MTDRDKLGIARTPQDTSKRDEAKAAFCAWFLENYPAGCILSKPAWHAPKVFNAAEHAIKDAGEFPDRKDQRIEQLERQLAELGSDYEKLLKESTEELRLARSEKPSTLVELTPFVQAVIALLEEAQVPVGNHHKKCLCIGCKATQLLKLHAGEAP